MENHTSKIRTVILFFVLISLGKMFSQSNPSQQSLPYSQNFGTTTFTVAPAGIAVWTVSSSPISSQSNAESSSPNGNATITSATTIQSTGGAYGYSTSSNGRLYFQTSSNATNGTNQAVLAISTTGWQNVSLSYGIEMVSATARTIGFVLQYRIGTSGSWTNVSGGVYSHNSLDRSNGQVDNYSVMLPSSADNQSVVQLRWACWRGTQSGNSSGAALDNISVSASSSQTAGYFRSKQNGNWNSTSTWEASADSITWVNATTTPNYNSNSILVKDSVRIISTDTLDQVTVSSSGILVYANNSGSILNIKNGLGVDLKVNGKIYDSGPSSIVWETGSNWELGTNASIIRTRSTSSNGWQDHYNNISNIPSTSNWYLIKNSSDNPSISSIGSYYGNLYILNSTGTFWTTSSSSTFTGSSGFPTIKGNLNVGGTNGTSFLNSNTNSSPVLVNGSIIIQAGSELKNQGTGISLKGDLTINGTYSTTGTSYISLIGNNTQTFSGTGLTLSYLKLNKSSIAANIVLSSPTTITGSLVFTTGIIVSDATNLLTFSAGSITSGVNDNSFVSGPVKKVGNTAFTFPLGKGNNAQIFSITAPANSSDAFQAEFFIGDPTILYGNITDPTFNYVSTCQYFNLQRISGASNIQPSLGYDLTSCISNLLPDPRVVCFDGTMWKDLGLGSFTVSTAGGAISTTGPITQYGPITLGNYDPAITGINLGDTCFQAVPMPISSTSTLTGQTQAAYAKWFTFTPQTSEIKITLTNTNMNVDHIHDIILFEGVCLANQVAGYDSSTYDTTLTIILHEAIVGVPYFIETFRDRDSCSLCSNDTAHFEIKVESLTPPVKTISNSVVYLDGVATHMKEQVIVRVNKAHLIMSNVDNTSITSALAPTFFDTETLENIGALLFNNDVTQVNKLVLTKVFPDMTSADSISISRDSLRIHVPEFYEIFTLDLPGNDNIFYTSRLLSTITSYSEPNFVSLPTSVPNDAFYSTNQENLHPTVTYPNAHINIEPAWDIETGKSFIRVGVFDSGIDQNHDDLTSGKVAGGYDYVSGSPVTGGNNDGTGHGTSCAGIIGAYRNNTTGVAGIAGGDGVDPGCSLFDFRIFNNTGSPVAISTQASALRSAATSVSAGGLGMHILSNSYGGIYFSITQREAIQFANENGVVFVAARGNYPQTSPIGAATYPACYLDEMVLNVGASGTDGAAKVNGNGDPFNSGDNSYSSMTGNLVDFIAPGTTAVVSTTETSTNGYTGFNGTSAACPHVAGVAALMLSHVNQPTSAPNNLVIEDVENLLQRYATDKNASGYDDLAGWGLINAGATLDGLRNPAYKVQHFGVNQNTTSASVTKTMINNHIPMTLVEPFGALAAGNYYGDKYLATITLNYNLSSPNDVILAYWPRISSTLGWSQANPVTTDNWCRIVSVSSTQAVLETYLWDFLFNQNGQSIDPLYPTSNPYASLSIYTVDPSIVGIEQSNSNSSLIVFPNPASNSSSVSISIKKAQEITLELYDIKGSLIKTIMKGKVSEGQNIYEISLTDLSDGIYFCRLATEEGIIQKKLVVLK